MTGATVTVLAAFLAVAEGCVFFRNWSQAFNWQQNFICSSVVKKVRIFETERAKNFLEATVFLQDDTYSRTCNLQDEYSVFEADLFCHTSSASIIKI